MDNLERVQRLLDKGKEVRATNRPNPPNIMGFPTLDSGAFAAWKSQAL